MSYPRAPITEAVLELRYAQPQSREIAERCAVAIEKDYFYNELEQNFNLSFDANGARVETTLEGRKLSSLDRADIVIFRTSALVCSRLAPYLGWQEFHSQCRRAWSVLKKSAEPVEVARIGLRYVNRIDIPISDGEAIDAEDYLYFVPKVPGVLGAPMNSFLIQSERMLGDDECKLMLISGTLNSPLLNTVSLALDIDVFRDADVPRREDELWALIDRMRVHKNLVFENCITDRARMLFS